MLQSSMSIDAETVRRLGGNLLVTESLLEGAPACKMVITKLKS
jgi:hypothetical protein